MIWWINAWGAWWSHWCIKLETIKIKVYLSDLFILPRVWDETHDAKFRIQTSEKFIIFELEMVRAIDIDSETSCSARQIVWLSDHKENQDVEVFFFFLLFLLPPAFTCYTLMTALPKHLILSQFVFLSFKKKISWALEPWNRSRCSAKGRLQPRLLQD